MLLEKASRDLILGLNRAFSKLYLHDRDNLYVTSQYARAVEQPVPLVKVKLPRECIKLKPEIMSADAFDYERQEIYLEILAPPGVQAKPINWPVDLLKFEYLMRLAQGGTYNVLNTECDLAIRQLKNQLLSRFYRPEEKVGRLSFFSAKKHGYELREIQVDSGRVRV